MQTTTTIGIDIGKSGFHIAGFAAAHRPAIRRRLGHAQLLAFMANLPPCLVGMEACAGAHHLVGHSGTDQDYYIIGRWSVAY
jgi:transposase